MIVTRPPCNVRAAMRIPLILSLILITALPAWSAPKPAAIRTVKNLPNFPMQSLRVGVNRQLFRSLQVSPITAWLVARAPIVGGRTVNAKVVHSEGNGAYDEMLLAMANGYSVVWQNSTESRAQSDTLTVHLLIYEIKDGRMAVCFSHSDDPRYADYRQGGIAWVGVEQGGKWTTISGKAETKWGRR